MSQLKRKFEYLTFFMFISLQAALACDCDTPPPLKAFVQSDFVARIRIEKNYTEDNAEHYYKSKIKIIELFKGTPITDLYISGNINGKIISSCDVNLEEQTDLIIYLQKNSNQYGISLCDRFIVLDKKKTFNKELQLLKALKNNNITYTNRIEFREEPIILNEYLSLSDGIILQKSFALYEVTFYSNLKIKQVKQFSFFNNKIDEEIRKVIKITKWNSYEKGIKNRVPENTKMLIGIFYYKAQENNSSFISNFFHQ